MSQKFQRLFYALAIFAVITTGAASVSVQANVDASEYTSPYDCIGNICVGSEVSIVAGRWPGHRGNVFAVDRYNGIVTVVNPNGQYFYPHVSEVRLTYPGPQDSRCVRHVCLGDQVRVMYGRYAGYTGQVVGTVHYTLQARVLIQGRSILINARDLAVLNRRPY